MTLSPLPVVLDACVLVDACLRDTLLRLAETPPQYLPCWSAAILDEVGRTLINKLGRTEAQWAHLQHKMTEAFPDARVAGFEHLIPSLTNQVKDRHVLAAAIKAGAAVIVTYNLKDFRCGDLQPWSVEAISPDAFLTVCLDADPQTVIAKLGLQAADSGRPFAALLERLGRARVGGFIGQVTAAMNRQGLPLI